MSSLSLCSFITVSIDSCSAWLSVFSSEKLLSVNTIVCSLTSFLYSALVSSLISLKTSLLTSSFEHSIASSFTRSLASSFVFSWFSSWFNSSLIDFDSRMLASSWIVSCCFNNPLSSVSSDGDSFAKIIRNI